MGKTLKDCLLEGGVKGKVFLAKKSTVEKYEITSFGIEGDTTLLFISYQGMNLLDKFNLVHHLDDEYFEKVKKSSS